jgi:hypothetical protein
MLWQARGYPGGSFVAQTATTHLGDQRRRSTRLEHIVPIVVRGVDLLGQPFEERTATQVLSFHGCRYASKHHLPKNTWVTLEIPPSQGQKEALCVRARVAWIQRPRTLRELFTVGVELESGANIWGVALPPEDWTGAAATGATVAPSFDVKSPAVPAAEPAKTAAHERQPGPLDAYLERMLTETSREPVTMPFSVVSSPAQASSPEESALLHELRHQFNSQARQILEEARAHAEQLVHDRTIALREELHAKLHSELKKDQRVTAEAFYQKWREEFENEQASAKEQINSSLAQEVTTQVSQAREEVRETLRAEWEAGLERAHAALADWSRQAESLREETRTLSEAIAGRTEQRLEEKLALQLAELRKELLASGAAIPFGSAPAAEIPSETVQSWKSRLDSEMAVTRAQWNELLESSLDSAAQRLIARLTENSQRALQSAEQRLAARVAELEQESGRSAETARAALDEIKIDFAREVSGAKASLAEIEKAAAHSSEYSRQLEAASQDSLNELRQRLEASLTSSTAEMEHRSAELLRQLVERAGPMMEQVGQQTVARAAAETQSRIAPELERVAEASRQLEAREQQAEEILRVHRERLRQVSEQTQKEAAAQISAALEAVRNDFESARQGALGKWSLELESSSARAAQEASASLASAAEWQLGEAGSRLKLQIEEALRKFQSRLEDLLREGATKFPTELEKIEAARLESARAELAKSAQERLDSARSELARASEAAAAEFGLAIRTKSEEALQDFSAASNEKAEQGRARLVAAGEQALRSLESHREASLAHFQEQLALKLDQGMARSQERLAAQLVATLDAFQNQGDEHVKDWAAILESASAAAFKRHEDCLRAAGDSWVDTSVRQLEAMGQTRVAALVDSAESATRKACVAVFEGIAQAMREQLLAALGEFSKTAQPTATEAAKSPQPPPGEANSSGRRASA